MKWALSQTWRMLLASSVLFAALSIVPTAQAATRPTSITSVSQGTCGWQEGWVVAFDTGETVIVGYTAFNTNDDPFVGGVSSFWRSYVSLWPPAYEQSGFTQVRSDGSHTDRIYFSAC